MLPPAFVAGLHLRWDGVRQRPHHLLSRIAREVPVVVVETPSTAHEDRDHVFTDGTVTVVRPLRRRLGAFVDDASIATARRLAPGGSGVWLTTPMLLPLADAFEARPLVYDVMDELAQFDFAPAGIAEQDLVALQRADLVFTGGRSLYAKRASFGAKVRCEPSGVDLERFAADVAPHPLPSQLRGPVFGYVGVIDERLDVDIIAALAAAFPDGDVVLVGPAAKLDLATLPRRENVHFTGPVPYDALPSWLAGFDVALMPFARNRATEYISPTKTLEYFAARKPVVSTPLADVVAEYADAAFIAGGPEEFAAAARRALAAPPERIARGLEHARARTWDAIAARMLDAVEAL